MRPRTPLAAIGEAVSTNATTVSRRSAVIAASSGLLVTMGLPAVGASAVGASAPEPRASGTTQQLAAVPAAPVISAPQDAQVSFALSAVTTVDTAQFQAQQAAERAEREASAARASRAAERAANAQAASRSTGRTASAEAPSRSTRGRATAAAATAATSAGSATRAAASAGAATRAAADAADEVASTVASVAKSSAGASGVLDLAKRYIGTPYRFGGTTPSGFDCSGFIQYVYGNLGVDLPRTASAQQASGTRVSASQAKPGDIVSFTGAGGVYHNGIYAGDGMMIDSPRSGKSIDVRPIWSSSVTYTRVG